MAKILCYRSGGMGDFITTIPKRYQIKENGDELYLLRYNEKYRDKLYLFSKFDNIPIDIGLAKEAIEIPYNKLKLLRFCIKNFRRFDKFYMPIKTKWGYLLGKILSKKADYTFENQRDTTKYKNIIEGEVGNSKLLSNYKEFFNGYIEEEAKIKDKYICIYASDVSRSLRNHDWINLIKYILSEYDYKVVLLGGEREKRFTEIIEKNFKNRYGKDIIDKIGKSDLKETLNLLKYSVCNICGNGGIMRCGCILNKNNLTIQVKSANVYRPPEDGIHTINVTQKKCNLFCDGECLFMGTDKENICKEININEVIEGIDKITEIYNNNRQYS